MSQSVFMYTELHEVHKLDSLDLIDSKIFRNPEKAAAESTWERLIFSLVTDSRNVRDVTFTELKECGLAKANLDGEVVSLFPDPRYSKLDRSICANGGNDGHVKSFFVSQ